MALASSSGQYVLTVATVDGWKTPRTTATQAAPARSWATIPVAVSLDNGALRITDAR